MNPFSRSYVPLLWLPFRPSAMGLLQVQHRYQTLYLYMPRITLSQQSTSPLLRKHPIRQLEATIKQLLIWCLLSLIKTQTTCCRLIPTYPPTPSSLPSLDSKTLCPYIVEGFLFTSIGEQLLLLVTTSHPSFASRWFRTKEEQDQGRKPLIFSNVSFFWIEACAGGTGCSGQHLRVEWLRDIITSLEKRQVKYICCCKQIWMMEFLLLHLSPTSNRNNVRLEPLMIDPGSKHFGMLFDGDAIFYISNLLSPLTCL
jgi:hypothetical protein